MQSGVQYILFVQYILCYSVLGMFVLQEAMKKKLEIQKQKQELLNKQIQEQKVSGENFIPSYARNIWRRLTFLLTTKLKPSRSGVLFCTFS